MALDLLILSVMFLVGGLATVLVGRRSAALGIPHWLGRAILISGVLLAVTGSAGLLLAFVS